MSLKREAYLRRVDFRRIKDELDALVREHGTIRAVAKALDVPYHRLVETRNGAAASKRVLKKLGYGVFYEYTRVYYRLASGEEQAND